MNNFKEAGSFMVTQYQEKLNNPLKVLDGGQYKDD